MRTCEMGHDWIEKDITKFVTKFCTKKYSRTYCKTCGVILKDVPYKEQEVKR